jgi:lipoyl-dependent peroxiredoxin subunit D
MAVEIKNDLVADLGLGEEYTSATLDLLVNGNSKYLKDLRVNFKNVLASEVLSEKEIVLIGLAVAVNNGNKVLTEFFKVRAEQAGASAEETAEAVSCASLLAVNNVFYRFRHFTGKEIYSQKQARIKMTIMMNPVTGKEFFELISLAVSAVNGCEMCVNSHEESVLHNGGTEDRIFEAIRIASVVTGTGKIVF